MQQKKRPGTRGGMSSTTLGKGQGPRRPVGMQAMGTLGYEQLRRALLLLGGAAGR
ncbi:hypothetical protein [Archangium lipolyticum]|uniref:hypothetical protein n=1 Tax=Archangium lipolyticum TaxID=2970465 RepID=UPI00214A7DD3|nr:hypothetical protein [Archangium lipolyticum]